MSLTNPNKIVTEERLSEFYGQILPYMGGMPEMLANKFSKGDLYSTDEKMIGQWIDGKPLYLKVVPFYINGSVASGWSSSNTKWYHPDFPANYIDLLVDVAILTQDSNGNSAYGTLYKNNNFDFTWYAEGYFTLNFATNYNNWFIMCYTKTTDSAISIGSDTDYSTDEKIVGTWTDGKPIYQKTFNVNYTISGQKWNDFTDVSIPNIGKIIDIKYSAYSTDSTSEYGINNLLYTRLKKNATYIEAYPLIGFGALQVTNITVQYTKTTDV